MSGAPARTLNATNTSALTNSRLPWANPGVTAGNPWPTDTTVTPGVIGPCVSDATRSDVTPIRERVPPMPNKPRPENPARPIRFDTLWPDVERIAAEDETTPSEVVREAVRRYIKLRNRKARP